MLREAARSTSGGAFPHTPISFFGFGKAHSYSTPFGSFGWLFLVESQEKLKQTSPE
jgi:hypothetical protein